MLDLSTHHHALRQPLHAIGLFCAALRSAGVPVQAQGLIDGIAASSSAMEAALEALFAQLEAAAAATAPSPAAAWGSSMPESARKSAGLPRDFSPAAGRAPDTTNPWRPTPPATATPPGTAESAWPVKVAPAPTPANPRAPAGTPVAEAIASEVGRARLPRVLIVDDDPSARLSLELLLEAWGAEVHSFAGTAELETFLAGASAQPPELCIVDYHLGHAGQGLTALALLRRAWPGQRLTLAMMTGDARAAHMAQQAQPDLEVLIKPVAPDALTGWIDKKVNSPR